LDKSCAGVLDVEGWRSFSLINAIYNTPGEACTGSVEVTDWTKVVAKMGGRSYFGDMCSRNGFDPSEYVAVNILGKTIRWTVDLSGAGCGCNGALYLASMRQNSNKSDCGDYYCDAASVCGVSCFEIDLMEANQFSFRSTLHLDSDPEGISMGLGNGYADWNASDYAPGSDCIDTNRPFQVAFSLPLHSDGGLAAVQVELSQDGGPCRPTASIGRYTVGKADGLATLTKVMQQGMTPVVSYWSSKEMLWLDGHACRLTSQPDFADLADPRRSSGANVDNCTKEKPCNLDDPGRCTESIQFYGFALEVFEGEQLVPADKGPAVAAHGPEPGVADGGEPAGGGGEEDDDGFDGEKLFQDKDDDDNWWPSDSEDQAAVTDFGWDAADVNTTAAPTTTSAQPAEQAVESPAPLLEFYMYRASNMEEAREEPGEVNTGNLDGVVWYLMNEVVTMYTEGPRCPRKFNISRVSRYKVKTRATKELYQTGMNFGVRFSYDFGMCMGRCFGGNMCTGADDCRVHYETFGFNPGCNNFWDMYPFPDFKTPAPGGIWYSLPLSGRCEGEPTGARNCTWSFEDAGWVSLEDVEATRPGGDNCCPSDRCTSFWDRQFDDGATSDRVRSILDALEQKYPDWPRELGQGPCDFNREKWYADGNDEWPRTDPWATPAPATTSGEDEGKSGEEDAVASEDGEAEPEEVDEANEGDAVASEGEAEPEEREEPEDHGSNQDDRSPKDDYSPEVTTGHATPTQDLLFEPVEETGDLPPDKLPVIEEADGDGKYDCKDGLASWEDEWVLAKALWCCKHENLGCLDEFVLRKLTGSQRVQS